MGFDKFGKRWFTWYKSPEDLYQQFVDKGTLANSKGVELEYDNLQNRYLPSLYSNNLSQKIPATYPNFSDLQNFIDKFEQYSQKIDSGGSFEKTRLKLSDDKRFMFSFSLASKGLIRLPEYYNEELAIEYPDLFRVGKNADDETMVAGVVDNNLVQSVQLPNGKTFFFCKVSGKEYVLRQQQKGTAKMLLINPNAKLIEGDDGMFYTDPTSFGDFNLKFSSTFKKSYIEMPKKGGKGKMVDIYIPFDMKNSELSTRLTSSIPLLLASKYFQQAGIKTRINIMRPIFTNGASISSIIAIPVKDFNDPIDFNKLAVLRGIENVGGSLTTMNGAINEFNEQLQTRTKKKISSNSSFARSGTGSDGRTLNGLMYDSEENLQKEFGRYKNWFREQVNTGKIKSQLVDKPLMLTFSTEDLLDENIDKILRNPNSSESQLVERSFFEVLDLVDLYYNEKISKVVSRIKKRFDENEQKGIYNPKSFKQYMIGLAGKLYRDLEPVDGMYASPPEDLQRADEKYKRLLTKLDVEFKKLGI